MLRNPSTESRGGIAIGDFDSSFSPMLVERNYRSLKDGDGNITWV